MTRNLRDTLTAYFTQQKDIGVTGYTFSAPVHERLGHQSAGEVDVPVTSAPAKSGNPVTAGSYSVKRAALIELYTEVQRCRGCDLHAGRSKLVFGAGNAAAQVLIVGDAPGFEEEILGRPFAGRSGELLVKMLTAIRLDREKDVFITDVLKCRPPENRYPGDPETAACFPILKRQITILQPAAILALGPAAACALLGRTEDVGILRAETHNYNGIPVVVTFHPSVLLREEKKKRLAWEDLQRFRAILDQKGLYGNRS